MDRILVDANSIGHAAHQGTKLVAGDQETQAIFGVIKAARSLKVRYPKASILFLWDGLSWRKAESTVYKANRDDDPKKRADRAAYKSQATHIRKALYYLGVPQLMAMNLEADDLAGMLVRKFNAGGDFTRMITGDRDWIQLVGENCIWEDHRDQARKVNHGNFAKSTGYDTATKFVQSKALMGDTSDNLPGVGKIGEKGAADLIDVWGNVLTFLADPDRAATYRLVRGKPLPKAYIDFASMQERQDKFYHNMKMMDLRGELPAPDRLTLQKKAFDPVAFKSLCHEFGFASIFRAEVWDTWIEPFSNEIN